MLKLNVPSQHWALAPGRGKTSVATLMGLLAGYSLETLRHAIQHGHPQLTIHDLLGTALPSELMRAKAGDKIPVAWRDWIPMRWAIWATFSGPTWVTTCAKIVLTEWTVACARVMVPAASSA